MDLLELDNEFGRLSPENFRRLRSSEDLEEIGNLSEIGFGFCGFWSENNGNENPRVAKRAKIRRYLRMCLKVCRLIVRESAVGGWVRMEYEMYFIFECLVIVLIGDGVKWALAEWMVLFLTIFEMLKVSFDLWNYSCGTISDNLIRCNHLCMEI